MAAMEQSPKNRDIHVLAGAAMDVYERGSDIVNLGVKMQLSASTMEQLLEHGAEQEGQWVEKLATAAEEVYRELEDAGSFYMRVGPFVRDYGSALSSAQSTMRGVVPECERLWSIYETKLEAYHDALSTPVAYPTGEDADDPTARSQAEQAQASTVQTAKDAKDAAYAAWEREAKDYDVAYDTWWGEFEAACNGIESANGKGLEDSWLDDLDGLVEFVQTVLSVAGLVLAALALIVGGPIVGLLALIVGVVALGLTIYQFCRGDADGWDLGFAIVGVLPIGAIGDFASGGFTTGMKSWIGMSNGMTFGDDVARWSLSATGSGINPSTWLANMRSLAPEAGFLAGEGIEMAGEFLSTHGSDTWQALGDIGHAPWAVAHVTDVVGNYFGVLPGVVRDTVTLIGDAPGTVEQLRWPTY